MADTHTARTPNSSPPIVVAFMNQKGGVGKTTTVVNLAAAAAETGHRVLVIDMDPQAHATLHLGHDPSELAASVYDALLEPEKVKASVLDSRDHLAILPAEVDLAAVEVELASAERRHDRLKEAIANLAGQFDLVFIDCPPSLGLLTLNALAAADRVIVPMQAHFLALQGVSKLLETVRLMSSQVNPQLKVAGVVLCMHEEQTTHGKEVVSDLDEFFENAANTGAPWSGGQVFRPGVRRNIKLAESPSFGQTIFEYAPQAPGASDYLELATVVLHTLENAQKSGPATAHEPEIIVRDVTPAASST